MQCFTLHVANSKALLQAINNYLSLLGWNEGTEQEVYSLDELKEKFSLDRITKSGAIFDRTKLSWMNGQHLKLLPHAEVGPLIICYLHICIS